MIEENQEVSDFRERGRGGEREARERLDRSGEYMYREYIEIGGTRAWGYEFGRDSSNPCEFNIY